LLCEELRRTPVTRRHLVAGLDSASRDR
jgi:hypothetical protein